MPEQPYMYSAPARRPIAYPYSDFDPKAVTRASWQSASQASMPRPKQEGPLIDFNKHPDSYMIVEGTKVDHKPLPPKTKQAIKAVRWVQFALRVLQLIGACGTLVCIICIQNAPQVQAWIMRIPPGWDILILLYAVYHLVRPAKGRTPASSASYHMFALFMDGGLVPFYIFIALFANNNYNTPVNADTRWTSFFNNVDSTAILLNVTWIAAVVMAGLHLISIGIDIYLVVMFRKIAKLPPDMNPLEDNLTSRRAAKHQYKNSEASVSTMSMSEKPPGYTSRSTLNVNENRFSRGTVDERAVPFRHSRMGSDLAYSAHNPESARLSRQQFDQQSMYQQAQSMNGSRQSFVGHARNESMSPSKRDSFMQPQDSTLPPVPMEQHRFNSPRPKSFVSARSYPDSPERLYTARSSAPSHAAVQSGQKESLLNDNWYVADEPSAQDGNMMSPPRSPVTPSRIRSPITNFSRPSPEPSPSPELQRQPRLPQLLPERDLTSGEIEAFTPQPLRMNPPTPPIEQQEAHRILSQDSYQVVQAQANQENHAPMADPDDFDDETATLTGKRESRAEHQPLNEVAVNRTLTAASQATQSSSVYSDSAESLDTARKNAVDAYADANSPSITSAGTPKPKYYGDLAGAMRGIRNQQAGYAQLPQQGRGSPKAPTPQRMNGVAGYNFAPSPPRHGGRGYGGGRVVSRTGADIADADLYLPEKSSRRRMVSGKDAEEGLMGGNRW